jgi:hypothetical protein
MMRDDLITAAPWIIFGTGLAAVWIRLLRSRRASKHQPGRSFADPADSGGADPRSAASGTERSTALDTQEGQCPEKNT